MEERKREHEQHEKKKAEYELKHYLQKYIFPLYLSSIYYYLLFQDIKKTKGHKGEAG